MRGRGGGVGKLSPGLTPGLTPGTAPANAGLPTRQELDDAGVVTDILNIVGEYARGLDPARIVDAQEYIRIDDLLVDGAAVSDADWDLYGVVYERLIDIDPQFWDDLVEVVPEIAQRTVDIMEPREQLWGVRGEGGGVSKLSSVPTREEEIDARLDEAEVLQDIRDTISEYAQELNPARIDDAKEYLRLDALIMEGETTSDDWVMFNTLHRRLIDIEPNLWDDLVANVPAIAQSAVMSARRRKWE
jgi:hypothetical protein